MNDQFRRGPRRRGQALEEAIYRAALDELAEHSFDDLSIERIAHRAGTGKSAIYRRWPAKLDLVVATLANSFPPPGPASTSGDLRADLILFHRRMAEALGGALGAALLANVGQHRQRPELAAALRERILEPRHQVLGELLAAGAARGEVRPDALTPECIETGPALLRQQFIESGRPPSDEDIKLLVDNVLIPMLRAVP
ncbi:MAG TPA: TetR/AcrR family transcriptional regulator [Trebonia sp.]|jgi:AcrR family transcriptional regulator